MKWIQITDVIKWIAVCVAISISVYVTRDWKIPLVSSHPCIPDLSGVMAI